jgi:hypothetical protein
MPNPITTTTTAVRAVVKHPKSRTIAGGLMAILGLIVILSEIGLHLYSAITHTHYEMDHIVLMIGAVIGMWGCYLVDRKTAEGAVGFVAGSVGQIVRGGRRSTDTPVVVTKPSDPETKP